MPLVTEDYALIRGYHTAALADRDDAIVSWLRQPDHAMPCRCNDIKLKRRSPQLRQGNRFGAIKGGFRWRSRGTPLAQTDTA